MTSVLTNLQELVFRAADDDDALQQLSTALAKSVDARSALLGFGAGDTVPNVMSAAGMDPGIIPAYENGFREMDPWSRVLRDARLLPFTNLGRFLSTKDIRDSIFYNEFLRPQRNRTLHVLGAHLRGEGTGNGYVGIQRYEDDSPFGNEHEKLLEPLVPQLNWMVAHRERLQKLEARAGLLGGIVDSLHNAVFLVDVEMKVQYVNARGEALLKRGDRVFLQRTCISCRSIAHSSQLMEAVKRSCMETHSCSLLLPPVGNETPALQATVTSFHSQLQSSQRVALILVHDPQCGPKNLTKRLMELYALTRGEAEVAEQIADGFDPRAIAEMRGVSIETVRTQLKRILGKTGLKRQAALCKLIASIPQLDSGQGT